MSADKSVYRPRGAPRPAKPGSVSTIELSHQSPPSLPPTTLPPELAGLTQYTDVRELGRGGMGVVYLARNTLMGRDEVLKVVNRAVLEKAGAAERFLREIRSAATLQHPNVVAAYSAHQLGDVLVLAMEYVPGDDLGKVVKARGPLPVANACYYAYQAALGLQHAHDRGLIHRDIKPANLILAKVGGKSVVKVLDFGLAKATGEVGPADANLTGDGRFMGTPDYTAPEQAWDAAKADIRADVYSLGCTLYCLLAGHPPFAGSLMAVLSAHAQQAAAPLDQVRPAVPADLAAVVAKMMAKKPDDRYPTPAEVAKAVAPFFKPAGPATVPPAPAVETKGAASTAPAQPAPPPAPAPSADWPAVTAGTRLAVAVPVRRRPSRVWPAAVAVGLFAVLAAGAAIVFRTPDGTIHLEGVPADAEVVLDGSTATVTRNGETVTLTAKRGPHRLKVVQGGKELLIKDEGVVTVGGVPVRVRVEPPAAGPPVKPAEGLAPEGSEWAGEYVFIEAQGQSKVYAVTFTIVERRGSAVKTLWRNNTGTKVLVDSVLGENNRLQFVGQQITGPQPKPYEPVSGSAEVEAKRMTSSWQYPDGRQGRGVFKRLPDGGSGFDFAGKWDCTYQPSDQSRVHVVAADGTLTIDDGGGKWERDGGSG